MTIWLRQMLRCGCPQSECRVELWRSAVIGNDLDAADCSRTGLDAASTVLIALLDGKVAGAISDSLSPANTQSEGTSQGAGTCRSTAAGVGIRVRRASSDDIE
jgi:hypothetical protein